jgi:hypothetical protein
MLTLSPYSCKQSAVVPITLSIYELMEQLPSFIMSCTPTLGEQIKSVDNTPHLELYERTVYII